MYLRRLIELFVLVAFVIFVQPHRINCFGRDCLNMKRQYSGHIGKSATKRIRKCTDSLDDINFDDLIGEVNSMYSSPAVPSSTNNHHDIPPTDNVQNHDMIFVEDGDDLLDQLDDDNNRYYREQRRMRESEKRVYIDTVREYLKSRFAVVPRALVLDIVALDPFPINQLFAGYMDSFPVGTFALVYKIESKVVVTKYKCAKMFQMQLGTQTDYEFSISISNRVTFTIDCANKFNNKIVIKTKHKMTTVFYNLDVHTTDFDIGRKYDEKALSLQLFR